MVTVPVAAPASVRVADDMDWSVAHDLQIVHVGQSGTVLASDGAHERILVPLTFAYAIVIANPALMAIKCRTPEQMALVNTLCWVATIGDPHRQIQ